MRIYFTFLFGVALMGAFTLIFISCSKESSSNPTTTPNSPPFPNSITVTLGGKQYVAKGWKPYTDNEPKDFIQGYVEKLSSGISYLTLTTSGVNHQFSMYLDVDGPANGLGKFEIGNDGNFKELFQSGEAFDIVGGSATVESASAEKVAGIFILNLENPQRSKTVTGSFDINQPFLP